MLGENGWKKKIKYSSLAFSAFLYISETSTDLPTPTKPSKKTQPSTITTHTKKIHKKNKNTRNPQIIKHLIKNLHFFGEKKKRKKKDKGLGAQYKNIPKTSFP